LKKTFKDDDDVAVCQVNSDGTVSLYHYYNIESNSVYLSDSNLTIGFSNIATSITNGVAQCSFTRLNYINNITRYYDISKPYYILTASGQLNSTSSKIVYE
jgi:hypothetical protein